MSVLGLIDQSKQDAGSGGIEAPSTEFSDVFSTSLDATARNYLSVSKPLFEFTEMAARDKKYKDVTGRNIYDDAFAVAPNRDELINHKTMMDRPDLVGEAVDNYLAQAKEKDPEKYGQIFNSEGISAEVRKKAIAANQAQAKATAGATGLTSFSGQLSGGLVAGFADPLNVATLPFGAGMASGILKTALVDAGLNAGTAVISHPFIERWQKELGQEYGGKELAEGVGMAALFGGIVGGGSKALSVGLEKLKLPNSTKLAEIRPRLQETGNFEGAQAARYEERRLVIEEADPKKYGAVLSPEEQAQLGVKTFEPRELDPEAHAKALEEVDAAINEERPVNGEKTGLSDDQVRSLDTEKMDDGLRGAHERALEPSPEPKEPSSKTNEIFEAPKVDPHPLETHEELAKLNEDMALHEQERLDFEKATAEMKPDERVFLEDEGRDVSIEELKNIFKDNAEYLKAISSCGIGKK